MENERPQPKEPTKTERLQREIAQFEADIKRAEQAEAQARNDQHWAKKRLKLAKDELSEIQEKTEDVSEIKMPPTLKHEH